DVSFQLSLSTDQTPPVVACLSPTMALSESGSVTVTEGDVFDASNSNDECGSVSLINFSPIVFDCAHIGAQQVTLTGQDPSGNQASCIATVTVTDDIQPVADVSTLADVTAECVATVSAPTATDNCVGSVTATTTDPTTYTEQGTYTITWTYDDANGNTAQQQQTVIVDDVTPPVPDIASLPNAIGQCDATVSAPTATDNCTGSVTATTADPTSYTEQGTYTITWTYDDGNGNSIQQTQTVIISDTQAPEISCSDNITASADPASCEAVVNWTEPISTDNCGPETNTLEVWQGYIAPVGDGMMFDMIAGSKDILVNGFEVYFDKKVPTTVSIYYKTGTYAGSQSTPGDWTFLGSENVDNIPSTYTPVLISIGGFTIPAGQTYGIYITTPYLVNKIKSSDANHSSSDGNLTVSGGVLLQDSFLPLAGGRTWRGNVRYSVIEKPVQILGLSSGSSFPVGTTPIGYSVSDAVGNTGSCSFTVTVGDNVAPVAICQDLTLNLDGTGNAGITTNDINNGSSDNCGLQSISVSPSTFNTGNVGQNTVTLTATDNVGNVGTCTATVTVLPNPTTTFNTEWTVTTTDLSITIPTTGTGYNYSIDWGDGTFESNQTGNASHPYALAGTYEVRIFGNFPRIYFNNSGDRLKLKKVKQWGSITWNSMENAFGGCENLEITATDNPDLSAITSTSAMFLNCLNLGNGTGNLSAWDVSNVTNMGFMFKGASAFNQNIGSWNVGNVANMSGMFDGASAFNQDIGSWNVGNVTDMQQMFDGATAFNQDIGNWNVGNVTEMSGMFAGASAFDQDIGSW
ncbi:MAG: BspA family leucine-rich repeat surface protein, partial [Gammaproteobacteria bacterium]|nr:BspA family leucine-rich repeat surface protein [Gammaproteobacteria bacterium]